MNVKSLSNQGYNLDAIRTAHRRVLSKKIFKFAILLFVIAFIGKLLSDYLAALPRERYAKDFAYWERVYNGAAKTISGTFLNLSAPAADPKTTQLKIIDIYIKGSALDELNSHLPETGTKYHKADVKIEDKVYKAQVRYRGDSINHWAFPQKSWRVRFRKGKEYEGMHLINFTVPRVETQFSNWLGYEMGNLIGGVLSPRAELVHFRLNRQFDGVRMMLEQPNQDFLSNRNLPAGRIYIGDISSEQIYGGVPRKPLYRDYSAWEIDVPAEENPSPEEMKSLVDIVKSENNPYEFFYKFRDIVDVNALASYMALLEMVGSVHVDETHNGKYYFSPVSGKFVPIVWDTVAYMWKNQKAIDLGSNSLFRKALAIPEVRELKDTILWNSLHGNLSTKKIQELIKQQSDAARPDIYSFALKIHANDKGIRYVSNPEWENSVEELNQIVAERNTHFISELSKTSAVYNLEQLSDTKYLFGIEVRSRAGLKLNSVKLNAKGLADGTSVRVVRHGLEDLLRDHIPETSSIVSGESLEIKLNDPLYSKRSFKKQKSGQIIPAQYVYEIITPKAAKLEVVKVDAKNSISNIAYEPVKDIALTVRKQHSDNIVWWKPDVFVKKTETILSGNVELKDNLILDKYSSLIINAGANLKLYPGVSIIAKGASVKINGTEAQPVRFSAATDKSWGVFAVNGSDCVEISNLIIEGAGFARNSFIKYSGGLNIFNSKAKITNCLLNGSYFSFQSSDVSISDSKVVNYYPFAIKSENSVVQKRRVEHQKIKAQLNDDINNGEAFGTPLRLEREYKYTIFDQQSEQPLNDLAEEIRVALSKSVNLGDSWQSPGLVGSPLYADQSTGDFIFRDIYFDTAEGLAFKNALSYRFRNRYSSYSDYKSHIKDPNLAVFWPTRLEIQAKTGREETGEGFSVVGETRFEFRKESKPFSVENPPPSSPWDENEFLPYMESGEFKGVKLLPARDAYNYLVKKEPQIKTVEFRPEVVLLTERYRQHLNIHTPWGSGPNPDQSYIISVDRSHIFIATDYLDYLNARKQGVKDAVKPKRISCLTEIEVEFERNVSDKLDQAISAAEKQGDKQEVQRLQKVLEAFFADQQTIMKVVQEYFSAKGIAVKPANKSKYEQAYEIVNLGTRVD
ncbi:MAG: CotH kinase family protein [Bdellovibrionales bacterium]|nr:CotH kinase family protein [Bdellovibrionales bacterium]